MADEPPRPSFRDVFAPPLGAAEPVVPTQPWPEAAEVFASDAAASVGTRVTDDAPAPRFDGDTSKLPAEACWALQRLIGKPYVTKKFRIHWAAIIQYEEQLRSRLSELGLRLEINREKEYAYTIQADDPSSHSTTLLKTQKLNLAASALALYLYQEYLTSPDNPIVDTKDMVDHMMVYERPANTDEASYHKTIHAAITQLQNAKILRKVTGTSDRYIVHDVITSILSADQIEKLRQRYAAAGITSEDVDGDDGE